MVSMQQKFRNIIRFLNKYGLNKLTILFAGKKHSPFAILLHTGRKSGKQYALPIIVQPHKDGFVIALTYGKEVDWFKNVMHAGVCGVIWKTRNYPLNDPKILFPAEGLSAFPNPERSILKIMKIQDFLWLKSDHKLE
jgi:deazaflavin-dependent oxidoreductase (nitroreductase family)